MSTDGAKHTPPRFARALLTRLIGSTDRDRIVAELDELYAHRRRRGARLWYWRQVLGFALRVRSYRGEGRPSLIGCLASDLRFSFRRLARRPLSATVIVATLGIVIGANTAVFSAVDAVLLAPLPYQQPDQLWQIWIESPDDPSNGTRWTSMATIHAWKSAATPFSGYAYTVASAETLTELGAPDLVRRIWVSEGAFDLLGTSPVIGRSFTAEDHAEDASPVIVLSHAFWVKRMGQDPSVIGSTLHVGQEPPTIIGVMPPGFRFPIEQDGVGWSPLGPPDLTGFFHEWPQYQLYARTNDDPEVPGVLGVLASSMPTVSEPRYADAVPIAEPLEEWVRPDDRGLSALLFVATLVMLLAAVNVSELLVASGSERHAELGIRRALGAGDGRIRALVAAEAMILVFFGGLVAVGVATLLSQWFTSIDPGALPGWADIRATPRTAAFVLLCTLGAGLAMAIVPVHRAGQVSASEVASDSRATHRDSRWIGVLLAVQAAAGVVVITGGVFLYRGWAQITRSDPGFEPEQAVIGMIYLPSNRYNPGDGAAHIRFFESLRDRIGSRPSIDHVAVATALPTASGLDFEQRMHLQGAGREGGRDIDTRLVSPDYFEAVGAQMIAGRALNGTDRSGVEPEVSVVNRAAARLLAPGASPDRIVGAILEELGRDGSSVSERTRIIGVVEDTRDDGLDRPSPPLVYLPYLQSRPFGRMWLVARHRGDASAAFRDIRAAIAEIDAELPFVDGQQLSERALHSIASRRLNLYLLGAMSLLALLLSVIGSAGLVGFSLARRRREIAVRIALGATPGSVRAELLSGIVLPLGLGVAVGAVAVRAAVRGIQAVAFGFGELVWADVAVAAAILLGSAGLCALVAARRAGAASPAAVLMEG